MKHCLVFFLIASLLLSCKKRVFEYIIPNDFEGCVFIFHNIKNGANDKAVDGKITFTIPSNGIYFTQVPFEKGGIVEYYLINNKGKKDKIEMNITNNQSNTNKALILDSHYKAISDGKKNIIDGTVTIIGKSRQDSILLLSESKVNNIFDSISSNLLKRGLVNKK